MELREHGWNLDSGASVCCLGVSGAQGIGTLELLLHASLPQKYFFLNMGNFLCHFSVALSLFPFLAKDRGWQSEIVAPFEPFATWARAHFFP